jgi:GGDEF domain-containing protein
MGRFARQNALCLTAVKTIPTQPMLTQMQHLACQNLGRLISLPWQLAPDGAEFVLSAMYPFSKELIGRRAQQADTSELEWTLARHQTDDDVQVWSHSTGDLTLILNLLSLEVNGPVADIPAQIAPHAEATVPSYLVPPQEHGARSNHQTLEVSVEERKDSLQNVALAGALAEEDFTGVLQSISLCKMTGRLDVQDRVHQAELYFENGVPVHASYQNSLALGTGNVTVGDQVVLDVLTWESGNYFFHRSRKTSEKTIKRKLEALMLAGMVLVDYSNYIRKNGVNADTVLQLAAASISDDEVEERLSAGVPVDLNLQKKLFKEIDGTSTLGDIVQRLQVGKSAWLPIIFNFVSSELIGIDSALPESHDKNAAVQVDHASITHAARQLVRPETGLLSYPLFLNFLKHEIARSKFGGTPFSISIFELSNRGEPLSNTALQQVASCFDGMKREFDMIGHSRTFDFALLLPLWGDEDTRVFCQDFHNALLAMGLDGVTNNEDLYVRFGIATVPEDGIGLESLLVEAQRAKNACKESSTCTTTRDLRWEELRLAGEQSVKSKNLNNAESIWCAAVEEAKSFSAEDGRLGLSLERLISIYRERGKQQLAEELLLKLLELKLASADLNVIAVARVRSELAQCFYRQGKYSDAELVSQQLVDDLVPHVGIEHPLVITGLSNLATVYHIQQQYARAEEAYKKALDILTTVFGASHAETIKLSNNFAKLLQTLEATRSRQGGAAVITGSWTTIADTLPRLQAD